jgi:prepilin-type processing-associated H-X9-DG protein/prepilin-type N-terminal cleavage/methylation domain-containing protein
MWPLGLKKIFMRTQKGFTIVELLAVLAVIIILTSLLIPAILKGREMARSGRCMANLKQIIQAVRLYVEEEPSGRLPGWTGAWDDFKQLMPLLVPYLGQAASGSYQNGELNIFRCPSNHYEGWLVNRVDSYGNRIDYEYNGQLNNQVAQTKIANPEWVSVLYDWPVDPAPPVEKIHRGGSNVVFYDGHVQWFSRDEMMKPHSPDYDASRKYDTWGLN